jgi:N6-L-threonylcarbamoyladenine synthase
MNVLGIETSCDETAAAVVRNGNEVLSNVVHSQADLHRPYGGVVPELASRSHVERLPAIVTDAMAASGLEWKDIDLVAATYGPGLASSLLVGLSSAKAIAMQLQKPFVAIDHVEAHIYSVFLGQQAPSARDSCPMTALVVSGGHTSLVRMESPGSYTLLGQTIDDAAGEAFDKGASLMGLEYPGGPSIQRAAEGGNPGYVDFPRSHRQKALPKSTSLRGDLCFSFSGLKTSLLYYLRDNPIRTDEHLADIAAGYQEAIVDVLVSKAIKATDGSTLAAVGGVSLNSRLRHLLRDAAETNGITLLLAHTKHCADNAAMVAGLAGAGRGISGPDAFDIDVAPDLRIAH